MATTKLQIITDDFKAGPRGFQLKDITFSITDAEVKDGFLSAGINDSDQYKLLVWPRTIKNIGTEKLVIGNSPRKHLENSGIDVVESVWYLVLKDSNGVEIIRQYQDGILVDLESQGVVDIGVTQLDGGQYLNISAIPFGYYELGIKVDPLEQWSVGNDPVFVKFQYRLGRIDIVENFPAIQPQDIQGLAIKIDGIEKRLQLIEHGGINP